MLTGWIRGLEAPRLVTLGLISHVDHPSKPITMTFVLFSDTIKMGDPYVSPSTCRWYSQRLTFRCIKDAPHEFVWQKVHTDTSIDLHCGDDS